ncbi:hypothetical protein F0U61_38275 [Archangium violaceum]|uniref:hypothetical protein n=1 Tax=Archangium violaceum TaxID=83451 RepID=UPI002B2C2870|nr:hypothetical protein F0U61_38275 [Archangium violaceum]
MSIHQGSIHAVMSLLAMSLLLVSMASEARDTTPKLEKAPNASVETILSGFAELPPDVDAFPNQSNMDLYAWREFIALNWPAAPGTCEPDRSRTFLDTKGPRVWETWLQPSDVFVPPGEAPARWCSAREERAPLGKIQQSVGGVLVDQNGRFVRYEVRLNEDAYNYLLANNLWNKAGQREATINLPAGPDDKFCKDQSCGPVGTVEVKAAWKVLGQGDDPSRFYTIEAEVYNDDLVPPTASPDPNPVKLGLVGLHIAHKTASQRSWLWATFEHVDNVTKSFNNPDCPETPSYTPNPPRPCTTRCCAPNAPTAAKDPETKTYVELDPFGQPLHRPTQVTRLRGPTSQRLSKHFKVLFGNSPWSNYELISNQWMGINPQTPTPTYLANTVMETFIQGQHPASDGIPAYPAPGYNPFSTRTSSSCIKCHSVAKTTSGRSADFSFLFSGAQ